MSLSRITSALVARVQLSQSSGALGRSLSHATQLRALSVTSPQLASDWRKRGEERVHGKGSQYSDEGRRPKYNSEAKYARYSPSAQDDSEGREGSRGNHHHHNNNKHHRSASASPAGFAASHSARGEAAPSKTLHVAEGTYVDPEEAGTEGLQLLGDEADDGGIITATTFEGLGIAPGLIEELRRQGIHTPLATQIQSIPRIAKEKNVLLRSCTGSGKTLSYLLPILTRLQAQGFPEYACVIMTPTRELAFQVYLEVLKLQPGTGAPKERLVQILVSGYDDEASDLAKVKADKPSILIGTPRRLLDALDEAHFQKQVKVVVMDEVDSLLKSIPNYVKGRAKEIREKNPRPAGALLERLFLGARTQLDKYSERRLTPRTGVQLVCASATINSHVRRELFQNGWCRDQTVVQVNAAMPGTIKHWYALCDEDPRSIMTELLTQMRLMNIATALVSVPPSVRPDDVVNLLRNDGIPAVAIYEHVHGKSVEEAQKGQKELHEFFAKGSPSRPSVGVVLHGAVRGLDFLNINHVFMAGQPETTDEYVHVAGRVGRRDMSGHAITIVWNENQVNKLINFSRRLNIVINPLTVDASEAELLQRKAGEGEAQAHDGAATTEPMEETKPTEETK